MIYTDEQKMFRKTLREFCDTEVAAAMPEILRTNKIPDALYKRCGEIGCMRAPVAKEYGGFGMGEVGLCMVLEELARVSAGLSLAVELALVNTPIILQEQVWIDKYLEPVLNGDIRVAGTATDPKGQPNVAEWEPMLTKDGDGYRVNGTRLYSTNNPGGINITLGLDEDRVMHAILVEDGMDGFEHDDVTLKLGCAGSDGGTTYFKNVWVPKENVTYCAVGTAPHYYMVFVGCAAEALGCMKGVYEKALDWLKNRTHDFRPLIEHKGIAYKIAYLKTLIELADTMVYSAAELHDAYVATNDPELEKEWHMKAETAKVRVSEIGVEVCTECIKLFGGMGYHDQSLYHYLGDSIDYVIMDQTNEIHFDAILRLMGLCE